MTVGNNRLFCLSLFTIILDAGGPCLHHFGIIPRATMMLDPLARTHVYFINRYREI